MIRIELRCVAVSEYGTVMHYEPMFIDDDEKAGHELLHMPDGRLLVVGCNESAADVAATEHGGEA